MSPYKRYIPLRSLKKAVMPDGNVLKYINGEDNIKAILLLNKYGI